MSSSEQCKQGCLEMVPHVKLGSEVGAGDRASKVIGFR